MFSELDKWLYQSLKKLNAPNHVAIMSKSCTSDLYSNARYSCWGRLLVVSNKILQIRLKPPGSMDIHHHQVFSTRCSCRRGTPLDMPTGHAKSCHDCHVARLPRASFQATAVTFISVISVLPTSCGCGLVQSFKQECFEYIHTSRLSIFEQGKW